MNYKFNHMNKKMINKRYEIIELLGKGGMGAVYKVKDAKADSIIALKVFSLARLSNEALSHFEKEFTTLSKLVHPNLIKVYDFGMTRDLDEDKTALPFFTMEYVDGDTIDRFFRDTIDFTSFYACIAQVAEGLSFIHKKGFLHNDIKSSNIMIAKGTETSLLVKIMDFGLIGRIFDVKKEEVVGTVAYVAPEKLKNAIADERSDIYSLGVVMYELTAGRLPFVEKGAAAMAKAHIKEDPLPPSTFNRKIPGPLDALILKCLEKEPAKRYQDADSLLLALQRLSGYEIEIPKKEIGKGYILSGGFIGRDEEFEKLKKAYASAKQGKSNFILISGEAGIGKSRLLKEFIIHAQVAAIPFYLTECYETLLRPYGPIIDILSEILRSKDESLNSLITDCCPEIFRLIPDLPGSEKTGSVRSPQKTGMTDESGRISSSLCRFFIEVSRSEPFVIILENINWLDDASAFLLSQLVAESESEKSGILILATLRTDELVESSPAAKLISRLSETKCFIRMHLRELDTTRIKELLASMTGNVPIPDKLLKKVMEETKGNPLFVEEYMSLLSDRGVITPGEKISFAEEEIRTLSIPARIADLMKRKVSRIEQDLLQLLQAASITGGKAVDPETLTAICGKKWDYVISHLNDLADGGIIEKISHKELLEAYNFKNISLRRIIYSEMPADIRLRLHKDYAAYLERRYKGRPFIYGELAHHFKNGGLAGKAADHYYKAGDYAAEISANNDAISSYSFAIEIMFQGRFSDVGPILCNLFEKRGKVRELTGDYQKAEEDYRWMLARAEGDKNKKLIGRAYINLADISFNLAKYTEALENYQKASEVLEATSHNDDHAAALIGIGKVHLKFGNFKESRDFFNRSLSIAAKLGHAGLEIQSLTGLALLSREMGQYKDSMRFFEDAEKISKRTGEDKRTTDIVEGIAMSLEFQGSYEEAISRYEEALEIAKRTGDILSEANVKTNLGSIYSRMGLYDKSLTLFEDAIKVYNRLGAKEGIVTNLQDLASQYLFQGQYQKALDTALEVLRIAVKIGKKDLLAVSHNLIGVIHLKLGDIERAEVSLVEARNIMREIKSMKLLSSFLIDLGELNLFREDFEKAKKSFQESCFIARRMGNTRVETVGLLRLAEAHLGEKDFSKSIRAVNKAVELAEASKLKKEIADIRLLNARIEIERPGGDIIKAESNASSALDSYRDLKDTEQIWQANYILGKILFRRGKTTEAIELLRRTHRFLEGIRSLLPDKWRRTFLNDPRRRDFYYEWEKIKGREKEVAAKIEKASIGHAAEYSILRKKADNLGRLMEINKKINSTLRLNELLETIIQTAIDLTGAERGFLILVEDGTMKFEVARSVDGAILKKPEYDISKSIAEKVMYEGTPLISLDAQEDDRFMQYVSVHELKLRSVIAMPLRSKGKTIGSIYLDSRLGKGVFTNDHLELLSLFSDQAGIAIENARLYDELALKKKDIEKLNVELEKTVQEQKSEIQDIKEDLYEKQSTLEIKYKYENIVGVSPKMQAIYKIIERVANTKIPVLIYGESGTGKELIARAIHYSSERKKNRYFTVNCAALTETLLESELFGYKKGAFTGANSDKKGFFEIADGGTILLDEIGDMSVGMQSKLLRVLEDGEILPVGGKDIIKVDVRIVSATNKNLKELIEKVLFREDLFFRLNVAIINLPPLRERREDIPLLVEHFLKKMSDEEKKPRKKIDGSAIKLLVSHEWPGNVRELEHELTKISTFGKDEIITERDVKRYSTFYKEEGFAAAPDKTKILSELETLDEIEKKQVMLALNATDNNKSKAADILGIDRATLFRKLKKYGIS